MSRRLPALFTAALLGLLAIIGLALSALGWVPVVAYAMLLVTGLVLARRRARPADDGRTCTCCTSSVYDPVTVVEEVVR